MSNASVIITPFPQNKNVSTPFAHVTDLKTNALHQFFVVSRNLDGTSLPSALITVNVSADSWNGKKVTDSVETMITDVER